MNYKQYNLWFKKSKKSDIDSENIPEPYGLKEGLILSLGYRPS